MIRTRRARGALPLVLAASSLLFLCPGPAPAKSQPPSSLPKYEMDHLPYRGQWGKFSVTVEKVGTDEFAPQRLRILDGRGEVMREVRDQKISLVEEVQLSGQASAELRVSGYSGGAHCCSTDYFFSREGGVRNVLIFAGGNGGINGIKPLGGDPRPAIIASSDSLAYFDDLPYAASPSMTMVIGWDGKQYVDRTRKYPDRSRALAERYRRELLDARNRRGRLGEEMRRCAAAGYYANAYVIGEGTAARTWLLRNAPASTRSWLLKYEKQLRKATTGEGSRLSVSQAKVLKPAEQ